MTWKEPDVCFKVLSQLSVGLRKSMNAWKSAWFMDHESNLWPIKVLSQASVGLRKSMNVWKSARFMDHESNPWPINFNVMLNLHPLGGYQLQALGVLLPMAPVRCSII